MTRAICLPALPVTMTTAPQAPQPELRMTKLSSNFYALDGAVSTIGVLVGPDGVFMVDAGFAPMTEKVVADIKSVSSTPIKFMVNTHVHADHTGGNPGMAAAAEV